jgi:hypothetical protein
MGRIELDTSNGEVVVAAWPEKYRTVAITNLGNLWGYSDWNAEKRGPDGYFDNRRFWKRVDRDGPEET